MAIMSSGGGFASGFAQGFADSYVKGLEMEGDAATLAAKAYQKDKDNFFEENKKDIDRINKAKQLVNQLYPKAKDIDKEARMVDALNLLRADVDYKEVKEQMEQRIYEEIKEEEKKEKEVVKAEETPVDTSKTGDIVSQTEMLLSEEDADKTGGIVEKDGENLPGADDGIIAKDADAKVKVDSRDPNFLQQIFTEEGREFAKEKRVNRRLDKLTDATKEQRDKFAGGYNPTEYIAPSGTVFTLKEDDDKVPTSLGGLLTKNVLESEAYINGDNETRRELILKAVKDQKLKDETEDTASLVRQLGELDPTDPSYDKKKADLLARIENYGKAQAYINRLEDSAEADVIELVSLDSNSVGKVTFVREEPKFDAPSVFVKADGSGVEVSQDNQLVLTKEIRDEAEKIRNQKTTEILKYNEKVVDTIDAVRLMGQGIDLIEQYPLMLTTAGGTVPKALKGIGIEVLAFGDTINKLAERSKGGEEFNIELADFESELKANKGLSPDKTLADIERTLDEALGSGIVNQATAKSLYETKILLMAFRLGGLEGQSGNALSNKDFERLQLILNPSRDVRVAKTALQDYMVTMIREQDTRATLINNDPNATGFENRYGINPYFLGAQPVKTIDQYAQGEYLEDAGFQNGYRYFKDYNPTGEEPKAKEEVAIKPAVALDQNNIQEAYKDLPSETPYSYIDENGNKISSVKP